MIMIPNFYILYTVCSYTKKMYISILMLLFFLLFQQYKHNPNDTYNCKSEISRTVIPKFFTFTESM